MNQHDIIFSRASKHTHSLRFCLGYVGLVVCIGCVRVGEVLEQLRKVSGKGSAVVGLRQRQGAAGGHQQRGHDDELSGGPHADSSPTEPPLDHLLHIYTFNCVLSDDDENPHPRERENPTTQAAKGIFPFLFGVLQSSTRVLYSLAC